MNKQIRYIFLFMIILYPIPAKADIDFVSLIQEKIDTVQSKVEQVTNEYVGDLSKEDLKKFTRGDFSSLKEKGASFLTEQAKLVGKSIADDMLAQYVYADEIGEKIKGSTANPELVSAISNNMARKTKVANDVQVTKEHNERINNMLVENIASMYATSLVKRKKLMNEQENIKKEEEATLEEVPSIITAYKSVSQRANSRWIAILEMMSNVEGLKATRTVSETKLMDEEAAKQELEQVLAEEKQLNQQLNSSNEHKQDLTKRLLADMRNIEKEIKESKGYQAYLEGKKIYGIYQNGGYMDALGVATEDLFGQQIKDYLTDGNGKYEAIGPDGEVMGYVDEKGIVFDLDGNEIGMYDEKSGTLVSVSGRTIGSLGQEKKSWVQSIYQTYKEDEDFYDNAWKTGDAIYDTAKNGGSLVDIGKSLADSDRVEAAVKSVADSYEGSNVEQSVNAWNQRRKEKKKEKEMKENLDELVKAGPVGLPEMEIPAQELPDTIPSLDEMATGWGGVQ